MKRKIQLAAVLALSLPLSNIGFAQSSNSRDQTIAELRKLHERAIEAEEKKDIPFLQELIADDCVVGNSQGQVLDKAHFMDRMKDPQRILHISNVHDVTVRLYGDVAIITEQSTVNGTDHGVPFGGDFRFVRVLNKEQGHWKVVLIQGTPSKAVSDVKP